MMGHVEVSTHVRETGIGRLPRRLAAVALAAACALLFAASPALAAPQVDGVFSVTGLAIDNQITQGPDGNIWVTRRN